MIGNIANDYSKALEKEELQVSPYMTVHEYYLLMERTIFTFNGYYAKDNNCRIWKFQSKDNPLVSLYKEIYKSTKDLTFGEDMTFEFSGDLLERASTSQFGELGIDENTVIVIEVF